jgi:hypothetical protein
MNTSYPRKALSLLSAFARSPRDLGPYLRSLPCWGRQPADLELPWLTFGAIRQIERHLTPSSQVFEFGSGGSTFYFARRAAHVTSVESHPEWHAHVTGLAHRRGLANLTCRLEALDEAALANFQGHPFFLAVQAARWDLILIDSYCGFETGGTGGQLRPYAFSLALPQLKPGGLIVVDDSWLYPALLQPRAGWSIEDCVGVGPCRYGVSSTALYRRQAVD